jgi:hypothetical protein
MAKRGYEYSKLELPDEQHIEHKEPQKSVDNGEKGTDHGEFSLIILPRNAEDSHTQVYLWRLY